MHPGVQPDIISTHSPLDLISDDVDIAFRLWIGNLPDSTLTVRHLATLSQSVFASTRHVQVHGVPSHPSDLSKHPALVTHIRKPDERDHWWLTDGKSAGNYAINTVATARDPAVLEAMMLAGEGLLLATDIQMHGAVTAGRAASVLTGWHGRPVELYSILPGGRGLAHKVRLVVDFVAPRLAALLSV